jgi:hypothetical protein
MFWAACGNRQDDIKTTAPHIRAAAYAVERRTWPGWCDRMGGSCQPCCVTVAMTNATVANTSTAVVATSAQVANVSRAVAARSEAIRCSTSQTSKYCADATGPSSAAAFPEILTALPGQMHRRTAESAAAVGHEHLGGVGLSGFW